MLLLLLLHLLLLLLLVALPVLLALLLLLLLMLQVLPLWPLRMLLLPQLALLLPRCKQAVQHCFAALMPLTSRQPTKADWLTLPLLLLALLWRQAVQHCPLSMTMNPILTVPTSCLTASKPLHGSNQKTEKANGYRYCLSCV